MHHGRDVPRFVLLKEVAQELCPGLTLQFVTRAGNRFRFAAGYAECGEAQRGAASIDGE